MTPILNCYLSTVLRCHSGLDPESFVQQTVLKKTPGQARGDIEKSYCIEETFIRNTYLFIKIQKMEGHYSHSSLYC